MTINYSDFTALSAEKFREFGVAYTLDTGQSGYCLIDSLVDLEKEHLLITNGKFLLSSSTVNINDILTVDSVTYLIKEKENVTVNGVNLFNIVTTINESLNSNSSNYHSLEVVTTSKTVNITTGAPVITDTIVGNVSFVVKSVSDLKDSDNDITINDDNINYILYSPTLLKNNHQIKMDNDRLKILKSTKENLIYKYECVVL